jgi:alkylated DNA repair dioxygenase AlkB
MIAAIEGVALSPFRFHGWVGKRLTASFGWKYDFENASFGPTEPIPGFLHFLRERAAEFAGVAESELVQAILTRYDPGSGIGWHRDREVFDQVIGVSLGAPATMRFRRRLGTVYKRASAMLEPRSVYHLKGEARQVWEHSIAPMERTRWSVTFRTLSRPPCKVS